MGRFALVGTRRVRSAVAAALLCAGQLLGQGCGRGGKPHHSDAWIGEGELGDRAARPGHVVLLDLEAGGARQRNSIPFQHDAPEVRRYCLDEGDPLIVGATFVDEHGKVLADLDATTPCKTIDIPAGRHTLHVFHDGTGVGGDRLQGFVSPVRETQAAVVSRGGAGGPTNPLVGRRYLTLHESGYGLGGYSISAQLVPVQDGIRLTRGWDDQGYPFGQYVFLSFEKTEGQSFECGAASTPGGECCLLEGEPITYYSTTGLDAFLGQGDQCTNSPRALRYVQDVGRHDGVFPVTWYDDTGSAYHLSYAFTYGPLPGQIVLQSAAAAWSPGVNDIYYLATELPDWQLAQLGFDDTLGIGQVALYDGSGCSGTATVNEVSWADTWANPMTFTETSWTVPGPRLWRSVRVGPHTRFRGRGGWPGPYDYFDGPPSKCHELDPPYGEGEASNEGITVLAPLEYFISARECRNCDLSGANLAGTKLDGVDFTRANLSGTELGSASLVGATLAQALLAGATLDHANLKNADLCQALLGAGEGLPPASLYRAYLKNANLAGADLSGANLTNVNFYGPGTSCESTSCGATPSWSATCATARGATLAGTNLSQAYLAGVDFSGSDAVEADFTDSILAGASFAAATMGTPGAGAGAATSFASAFLQGTDFTGATVTNVSFDSAYVDLVGGKALDVHLAPEHTDFTGYWNPPGASTICVRYGYDAPTKPPAVDGTNVCPDGYKAGSSRCSGGSVLVPGGKCPAGQTTIVEDCWNGTPRVPMAQTQAQAGFDVCSPFGGIDTTW